jgi:hypothetical protein
LARPYNRVVPEFSDLEIILTVIVVLTTAAVVVFFDCRKKQRRQKRQRAGIPDSVRPRRSLALFDSAPLQYESAKKLAAERPLEPQVANLTVAKPPKANHAVEHETVTIQMTGRPDQPECSLPAFTIDAALWERLIASMPTNGLLESGGEKSNPQPSPRKPAPVIVVAPGALDAMYQVIQSEKPQRVWPSGMIQQPAFQKLLNSDELFSGLVVSIGVNETDSSMWHSSGLMQSIGSYIAGLLRDKDFSCRTDFDEFIVACPGEHGAQSQRRLNQISERLWDYQLRGLSTCSILFSWGGVEVSDQPLAEAVASAVERMRQTKRTGSPSGSAAAHRQAV